MNIHEQQPFWCERKGARVLTHSHILGFMEDKPTKIRFKHPNLEFNSHGVGLMERQWDQRGINQHHFTGM
jgi:hypothetical protein